jgi:hypothetical protein
MLSNKLSPFERFFAGLLRSEAGEYVKKDKARDLWAAVCKRLGLPVPSQPLLAYYDTQKQHFANRASLVMEEARQSMADGLNALERHYLERGRQKSREWKNAVQGPRNETMVSMKLLLTGVEHKEKCGHSLLSFSRESGAFTREEMMTLRNGTVFACLNEQLSVTVDNVVLGAIVPQNREEMINTNSFVVMVFKLVQKTTQGKWDLTAIASLLSEQRKFEACAIQMSKPVPFIHSLLGGKKPTHLRFVEDDGGGTRAVKVEKHNCCNSHGDRKPNGIADVEAIFRLPRLNDTQEKAASSFLTSKSGTISLVQGPPGSGKTVRRCVGPLRDDSCSFSNSFTCAFLPFLFMCFHVMI